MWNYPNLRLVSSLEGSAFEETVHLLAWSWFHYRTKLSSAHCANLLWSVAPSYDGGCRPSKLVIETCSRHR